MLTVKSGVAFTYFLKRAAKTVRHQRLRSDPLRYYLVQAVTNARRYRLTTVRKQIFIEAFL